MMVSFLGIKQLTNVIRHFKIEKIMLGLVEAMIQDFKQWHSFSHQPRIASYFDEGVIELMPIHNKAHYSFKYVNGHPFNTQHNKLSVTGFGVLAEIASGYPIFIAEMTLLTAIRTAATSVVAAKYLANPKAQSMGLIGLGAQAEFQALAFYYVLGIKQLKVYDVDPKALDKFMHNMQDYPIKIEPQNELSGVCQGVDILTTATTHYQSDGIISKKDLHAGMHINAIGGDSEQKIELHPDLIENTRIFVEYAQQTRKEGEIKQHPNLPITELWEVISQQKPGRQTDKDITLFDSVGFALEDYSTLRYIYELTEHTDFLDTLDLIPDVSDPKNLFGLLK